MLLSAAQEPHIESLCEEILLNEEPNVPFRRSRKRYYQIDADLQSQVEVGWSFQEFSFASFMSKATRTILNIFDYFSEYYIQ